MAVVNGYCTVLDVRGELADAAGQLDTSLIEKAVNVASRAVDLYCGRRFWLDPVAKARRYRPDDPETVWVRDIGSTAGLVVETDPAGDGSWAATWTADVDYQLEPLDADADGPAYAWWRITAIGHRRFPVARRGRVGRPTLRVTARHGWSQVPDEVGEAATLKAVSLFRRKDAPFGVVAMGDFGAVRITRRDPDVIELLDGYQRGDLLAV
ncbi:MAG TPA: hypothetical protein VMU51_34240 [Mycobacteriales bacterium]|nr:hypothetical protein [Mycobacteriales bacterium]